ncbi:Cyclic di-GMP phosphodiesterase response regulator RpfG [bacterium HR36]|nr:Cyclic di-GMP phosphodiesterase response regulator RpfG [bacterium HR36]
MSFGSASPAVLGQSPPAKVARDLATNARNPREAPSTLEPTLVISSAQLLLGDLLKFRVLLEEELASLPADKAAHLQTIAEPEQLLDFLVAAQLLTPYQAERVRTGKWHGLVVGGYRILDRLGSGGMGTVYKGEHLQLHQLVAIKIVEIQADRGDWRRVVARFRSEARAIVQLRHPHIVRALDAGEVPPPDSDSPALYYYVMEFVEGEDLERLVNKHGPLPIGQACEIAYQVASALQQAHHHQLVHRDIKPSNIMLTRDGQAKLLDFGLVRHLEHRMTEPGTVLGTLDYIAPEQASDASSVDIRADIYSLGATLFWCLTGRPPFPSRGNAVQDLLTRRTQPPPSARALRPDIPPALDAVLATMLQPDREKRYTEPQAVMNALLPFLRLEQVASAGCQLASRALSIQTTSASHHTPRILIIDDEMPVREFCRHALQQEGYECETADSAANGLALVSSKTFDLVLLDWNLPDMEGPEVVARIRQLPLSRHVKIVMISGRISGEELSRALLRGADDYLCKPFSLQEMLSRIKCALALKDAQEALEALVHYLTETNARLEQNLTSTRGDFLQLRNTLVQTLALAINYRDPTARRHHQRMPRYARRLAEAASLLPAFAEQIEDRFIRRLEAAVPLHDLGKVGLPDHIRFKDTLLSAEERLLMQMHTLIGYDILTEMAQQHEGHTFDFLRMAAEIARHHHERFDGTGYPDRLAGQSIPLAARITAICDTYDALCSPRPYRPALPHDAAVQVILKNSPGQFDPDLLSAFEKVAPDFALIFRELPPT